MLVNLNHN